MQLKRITNDIDRTEWLKVNENWDKIEYNFNNVVATVGDEAFQQVIDSIIVIWKEPVATFADLATAYPNPEIGWAAQVGSDEIYRYDGTDWKLFQNVDMTPINALETRIDNKMNARSVNAKEFGATGDGVTDDTTNLQAAFDAAEGGVITLPYGSKFKVTGVTVRKGTTVIAYGASIFNEDSNITIIEVEDGCNFKGLEIYGTGNDTLDYNGRGIYIQGEYNSTLNTINYNHGVKIVDCNIHDISGYGVLCQYADYVKINDTSIKNIGFAGVQTLSSKGVKINDSEIVGIKGNGSIGYNVAFTRDSNSADFVRYPRSSDCSVSRSLIADNPTWEGLDTHGGENIDFHNNTIRNCKIGIAFVGVANNYAPQSCVASMNDISLNGTGIGIVAAGANDLTQVFEYADNCRLIGNKLTRCGEEGNNISGGIHMYATRGIVVQGNTLRNCFISGINIYRNNVGYVVQGNSIIDVQSSSITADGIDIRSDNNDGVISGNTLMRINTALNTNVMNRGIRNESPSTNVVRLGINYNNAVTELSGMSGAGVVYMSYGVNSKFYMVDGSPEGVVTAPIGSICLDRTGTIGSTMYIKESGTAAAGWRPSMTPRAAATSARPANPMNGTMYYDTLINKPIWYVNGWKDADGNAV